MLVIKQFTLAIDFHSRKKNKTMEVNGYHQLSAYKHSSKATHTGLKQHDDE